ncbi:hypothetical protein K474DRAFT_1712087 [Panus rudis PR-1116 ss-1]|nr:hypothetical protein K474DRAFT_1712087 [Panus rudis PR-1116 ss-1]
MAFLALVHPTIQPPLVFTTSHVFLTTSRSTASPSESTAMSRFPSPSAAASLCVVIVASVLAQVFAGPVALSNDDNSAKGLHRRCLGIASLSCQPKPTSSGPTILPPTQSPNDDRWFSMLSGLLPPPTATPTLSSPTSSLDDHWMSVLSGFLQSLPTAAPTSIPSLASDPTFSLNNHWSSALSGILQSLPTPTTSNPLAITSGAPSLCEQLGDCSDGPTPSPTLGLNDPNLLCEWFGWPCTSSATPTPTQKPVVLCGGLPCDRGESTTAL